MGRMSNKVRKETEQRILELNEFLTAGGSARGYCKSIKVPKSTLLTNIKALGYSRDVTTGLYGIAGTEEIINIENEIALTQNEENKTLPASDETIPVDIVKTLLSRIEKLERIVDDLSKNINSDQLKNKKNQLIIKEFKEDAVVKNLRLHGDVIKDIHKLKEKYPQYTLVDMLSTILFEGINKYL